MNKKQKNAVKQAINKQISAFQYERDAAKESGHESLKKGYKAEIKTLKKAKQAIKKA